MAKLLKESLPLFLISFGYLAGLALFAPSHDILWSDELFYYFQARNLLVGKLVWFENTVPFMSPLILAPFSFSLLAMRLWAALIMSLGLIAFYSYAKGIFSKKLALLSWLILLLHAQTSFGVSLFSENVFFGLSFFYLNLQRRYAEQPRMILPLGILVGILMLTRPFGIFWPLALGLELLIGRGFQVFKSRAGWSLIGQGLIAVVIYQAWLARGGFSFVSMMITTKSTGNFPHPYIDLPGFFTFSISIAFLFGLLFGREANFRKYKFGVIAIVLFSLANAFLISNTFIRHFLAVLPLLVIYTASGLLRLSSRDWRIGILIVWCLAFLGERIIRPYQDDFKSPTYNHYYLAHPGCQAVSQMKMSCQHLETGESLGPKQTISLPFLDQPLVSRCSYEADLNLNIEAKWIYLAFFDDWGFVHLDERRIAKGTTWNPSVFPISAAPGNHRITAQIENQSGFGGIGQMLFCSTPLHLWPTPSGLTN
jgi:hypothetical protein